MQARCQKFFHFLQVFCLFRCSASWSQQQQQCPPHIKSTPITSLDHRTCPSRRSFLTTNLVATSATLLSILEGPRKVVAEEIADPSTVNSVQVIVPGDVKQLFNEGRAFEGQGNMAAAQRLYAKVTKIAPRFIYGWSNLGNTQTAFGDLPAAEVSYSKAIDLCHENLRSTEEGFGARRCSDLYLLLLNRGSLRLNNGMPQQALKDLQLSNQLRGRPDALILQNLARAEEINSLYDLADRDYTTAISMTANEVNPFWLRAAIVKFQLGDVRGGFDLLKRVEIRFPEAPEVRAAYATFLAATGEQIKAQQKYLEIPDRQRLKYVDREYLTKTIVWPPAMIEMLAKVSSAAGDTAKI